MRRWSSIAKATALEILSEPLSLLLLLAALVMATLAPAFHYHQFGEATRMARDAGFSALFLGGVLTAVFGTVRTFRREIETGTAQMALAHPVSRTAFFLSKVAGAFAATAVFCAVVALTTLTVVNGAAIGGELASRNGDVARLWGPSFAIGMGTMLLPLVLAAALNHFARFRFVLTFFALALATASAGAVYRFDLELALRLAPVAAAAVLPVAAFLSRSAAAAVKFRANGAVATAGLVLAASVPVVGNYYLPDALSKGGELPWGYVGLAAAALLPAVVAFLLAGVQMFKGRDVS